MLKHTFTAAFCTVAIAITAFPAMTGSALAQRIPTTTNPNCTAGAGCNTTTTESVSTYSCSDSLGYLRRVAEEELDAIDDEERVWITPVCENEDYGVMRNDGNAAALRGVIADNDAMVTALAAKAFVPDDVVGVRMIDDDTVTLFVHTFHHR